MDEGSLPPPAHHEKFRRPMGHPGDRITERMKKYDVAIYVTKEIVSGDFLGAGEDMIEALGSEFAAANARDVADTQFLGDFGGTWFLSKQKDFALGMQAHPTANGILLNNPVVALEGLGSGENRQHFVLKRRSGRSTRVGRCLGAFNCSQLCKANFRGNIQEPAPFIARMLEIRSRNDHFRKTIPKVEEFMLLPKTYLPEIGAGTQRQVRKRVRDAMKSGLQPKAVRGSAPYEFTIGAKQGDSVMTAMKPIAQVEIEMNGNFPERIQAVGIGRSRGAL